MRAAFVDAEAQAVEWINASSVAGAQGGPVTKGAHLQRLRSAAAGTFILVTALPGTDSSGDTNLHLARVTAAVYGPSKADAATAAVAYANLLRTADGSPILLSAARLYAVEDVTGPSWLPDVAEPRYLVDATFVFQPL